MMGRNAVPGVRPGSLTWRMYASFAAAGAGCALPGVLLPLLRAQADDARRGTLFLVIAAGAALGPVALGRRPGQRLGMGFALIAVAAAGWMWRPELPLPFGFCWGLGLGMVMTALSLLSPAVRGDHGVVLMRMNFLWAVGAWACPPAVGLGRRFAAAPLLVLLAAAVLGAVTTLAVRRRPPPQRGREAPAGWGLGGVSAGLVLATALAPGIEASAGAWLATYASRALHTVWFTLTVPTCFWGGLMVSRGLSWLPWGAPKGSRGVRALLALVVACAGLLLLPLGAWALPGESFGLGFGLGPLYPLLLARVLRQKATSAIFVAAGVASSVMPWATGQLSEKSGSLAGGLLVPVAGSALLLWTGWRATGQRAAS